MMQKKEPARVQANVQPRMQPAVLAAAIAGLAAVALAAALVAGPRQAAAALIGAAGGLALYHASFGFAGGWRRMAAEGNGRGIRAQLMLIALMTPASLGLIASGHASGWVVPAGIGLVTGAALFGIGMQLAGGCGSGTLFTVGGGSVRMLVVLACFVAGSLAGTAHVPWWNALPALPPVSLPAAVGTLPAILGILAACALLAALTRVAERGRHPTPAAAAPAANMPGRSGWLRGPWPPWAGAAALALVSVATLAVIGRPWGITSAFALWGAKAGLAMGLPVDTWSYWSGGRLPSLAAPVLADTTSVMDFGTMLGALAAAGLAGRFAPDARISAPDLATAIAGGLLMGYGARLSSGCNIGALLGGITSGSLHGWVWFAAAFAASTLTVRARLAVAARMPQNAPS